MRAPRIAFAIVLPVLSSLGPVLGVGNAAALPRAHGAAPDSPKFYFPRRIKRQLGSSSPFLNITNLNAKPNAPKSGQPGSKHDKLDRLLSNLNGGDNEPGATTWTKTVDKVKTNTLSTPTVTQNPRPNIPVQNVPNELRPSSNDGASPSFSLSPPLFPWTLLTRHQRWHRHRTARHYQRRHAPCQIRLQKRLLLQPAAQANARPQRQQQLHRSPAPANAGQQRPFLRWHADFNAKAGRQRRYSKGRHWRLLRWLADYNSGPWPAIQSTPPLWKPFCGQSTPPLL